MRTYDITLPLTLVVEADGETEAREAANNYIGFVGNETANASLDLETGRFVALDVTESEMSVTAREEEEEEEEELNGPKESDLREAYDETLSVLDAVSRELLEELREGYGDLTEMAEEIMAEGSHATDERVHETADSNVSVYTSDRLEWLQSNICRADQKEAMARGAKTADDIAACCWYDANLEDLHTAVNRLQRAWQEVEGIDEIRGYCVR